MLFDREKSYLTPNQLQHRPMPKVSDYKSDKRKHTNTLFTLQINTTLFEFMHLGEIASGKNLCDVSELIGQKVRALRFLTTKCGGGTYAPLHPR